jgi:hypothetical protein
MGLRILLGVTLVSLLVVLGSSVHAGQRVWEAEGVTAQGEPIWFGFGRDGRPNTFSVDLRTTCTWSAGERRLQWWQGEQVVPFTGQGSRLRATERGKGRADDGSDYEVRYDLEARMTGETITGTVSASETWSRGASVAGRCWAGPAHFTVRLG